MYEKKYKKIIPVFVAGGIYTGSDIAYYLQLGAAGVQMGTRFIATEECDAHAAFKQAIVNVKKEEIQIVKSPAGFPGRAIMNTFMKKCSERGNLCIQNCLQCLTPCHPEDTPYCISEALIQAVQGNLDRGLIFVGSNAWRIHQITTVKALMEELIEEMEAALAAGGSR